MSEQLSQVIVENIIMEAVSFEEKCGSWNESGLLASLDRKGFTPQKCFTELIANSNDNQATQIVWKITCEYIKLVDDGIGMDRKKLNEMFDMFRANNEHKKSMGVSGLGGKEGMYILSKKLNKEPTTVILNTHTAGGDYLKAIVPWKKIIDEKIYTNQVIITNMTPEEINDFTADRENCQFKHGTTIRFEYNDELKNLIVNSFNIKFINKEKISVNNRWEFVFGHSNAKIIVEISDGSLTSELIKYNYFSGNDMEFYAGKETDDIIHYIDDKNNDRYVYVSEDGPLEIQPHGKNGYKTEPTTVKVHQSWKRIGSYQIFNGMRKENNIFNPLNPFKPLSATMHLNPYDKMYFPSADAEVEYIKDCLSGCSVYRNEQLITKINFDDKRFNASTSRACGNAMIDKFYHRTEIHYLTESTQDNRMDIAMGIQENKNQHQNVLPKQLERLITYIKSKHLDKIYDYFDQVIKAKAEQEKKKRREEEAEFDQVIKAKVEQEKKKRREEEAEKKRLEEEAEKKRLEEEAEKKRCEEEAEKKRCEEMGQESEEDSEEESQEESEEDSVEAHQSNASDVPSDDSDEESISDSSSVKVVITPIPDPLPVVVENLEEKIAELKNKILEKINGENDYDKMQKIYELISNL